MKCEDVRVLLAAYRRSEWTLDDQRAVSKHLAGCAACRRWEADARSVGEHLRELPTITPPASLRERVFAAIREEQLAASTATREDAVTVVATPKPAPISIAAARNAATQPVRAVRHVPATSERVGEVAIGKMRAPRVWLGRNTAIATVAALFALIFLIRAIPLGTTQLPSGNGGVAACVNACSSAPHTFKANTNYPTVTSVLASGSQAVYVGKSSAGQQMLFVTDLSTKKTFLLLDAPTSNQLTVVAITPKLLVWSVGNPASAKSDWTLYALPLTNNIVPATIAQPFQIATHNGYLQGDSSAIVTINSLWVHGQSLLLAVTTQHVRSELVRADLASDGSLFTDTPIVQATNDHAFVDPYFDDTTMYWVDATTATDGTTHHTIWQQSLQAGAVAAVMTAADVDAFGPVTDQQGIAWIQATTNPTPEHGVGDMTTAVLSLVTHQGSVDSLQANVGTLTGITAQSISRADGYFFWIDATGAHFYRPGQSKQELTSVPNGAVILGLSASAITWVMPNDPSTVSVQAVQ